MSGFKSPNYTQIPNDFFDMLPEMSDAELRVTLIMMRETFGYHRDAARVGMNEMAHRAGLSYNGATAGCECGEARGTFRRTNPGQKVKAEWELIIEHPQPVREEPSASEGDGEKHPQPVRITPSASEGQVGLNKKESLTSSSIADAVFQAYEHEFGALTPMISDALQDAINTHTAEWVLEAMEVAVRSGVRRWRYVEGILKSCQAKNISPKLSSGFKERKSNGHKNNRAGGAGDSQPHTDAERAAAERIRARRKGSDVQ